MILNGGAWNCRSGGPKENAGSGTKIEILGDLAKMIARNESRELEWTTYLNSKE